MKKVKIKESSEINVLDAKIKEILNIEFYRLN